MTTRNALDTLDSVNASSLRFIRVGRLGYFAVKWCGHGRFYLQGENFMDKSTPVRSFTLLERTVILGIYTVALFAVHRISSGSWIPSSGLEDLWLISAIGLLSFDLLSSPFFVKPSDVLASTLASLLLLWSLDLDNLQTFSYELNYFRWFSFAITTIIMIFSIVAIVCQKRPGHEGIARISYRISTRYGKGEFVFTAPALISILGFHQTNLVNLLILNLVWVCLVSIRPFELLWASIADLRCFKKEKQDIQLIGEIVRVDSPNIIRVDLKEGPYWDPSLVHIAYLSNKQVVYVLPLFTQIQDERLMGTGFCIDKASEDTAPLTPGFVYKAFGLPSREDILSKIAKTESRIVGFVVEDSTISQIQFEIIPTEELSEGSIVFCLQRNSIIFYQVIDARTFEESFHQNPRGTHIVSAVQLGILGDRGFKKFSWLPEMNSPVFTICDFQVPTEVKISSEFTIGNIPGTQIPVRASFDNLLEFHTAILGVTGTGKTELAFDIIRKGMDEGAKIFCVDFTGDYAKRLEDLQPTFLGLREEDMSELARLIENIETGNYSAADEKQAFNRFVNEINPIISSRVSEFLESEEQFLGIFEFDDIANTRATLRATELYLSAIFKWAKENRKRKNILVVLEEAHTVIPEMNLFGYDRSDTTAVVGRISQIALQGRKYGVGLLLVSQRTALVSKTLLSQCNTVISFSLVDKTSLEYLSSVYSQEHVRAIPNLKPLHALVFGKGIKSERPVIVQIPFDEGKKRASEELHYGKGGNEELPRTL